VNTYIAEGVAELVPGVLFIDEVHMLDLECFTFLNRALESTLAPIVILATNRGMCSVRGTDMEAPHGIPVDLLDRLMIIRTLSYTAKEVSTIITIRANTESISIDQSSLVYLAKIAERRSLRYSLQLLTPAKIIAGTNGRDVVTIKDLEEVDGLFFDAKTSGQLLEQQKDKFLT